MHNLNWQQDSCHGVTEDYIIVDSSTLLTRDGDRLHLWEMTPSGARKVETVRESRADDLLTELGLIEAKPDGDEGKGELATYGSSYVYTHEITPESPISTFSPAGIYTQGSKKAAIHQRELFEVARDQQEHEFKMSWARFVARHWVMVMGIGVLVFFAFVGTVRVLAAYWQPLVVVLGIFALVASSYNRGVVNRLDASTRNYRARRR